MHGDGKLPGESFFTVRAGVGHAHSGLVGGLDRLSFPYAPVKADVSAVERVRAIVDRQRVLSAVQCEFSFGDAVRDTADNSPEMRMRSEIAL